MRITGIIWLDAIVAKLAVKHRVEPEEVEEVFASSPQSNGRRPDFER